MTETLLRTKLYKPPVQSSLVPRPRLVRKLNQGLAGKLTLVSAPVGFGKSALVSEWLAASERSNDCTTNINREMMVGTSGDFFLGSSSETVLFSLPKL